MPEAVRQEHNPLVLVVEDDRDISDALSLFLADEAYRVTVAPDGIEALRLVEEARPDVILLDLMLPRLDGLGVARALREQGLGPDRIPIIVYSAGRKLDEAMREVGTPFSLVKPFDLEQMLSVLERALAPLRALSSR